MADLVVIVPSRGRPEAANALALAFQNTCTANTRLVFAVDDNDETLEQYSRLAAVPSALPASPVTRLWPQLSVDVVDEPTNMVRALNVAASFAAMREAPTPFAIGFMGDDHMPRTYGWDTAYLAALHDLGTGIVYGDDLLQGRRLPTQCAMTTDIVQALGYMAPPALTHLYVDNFWLSIGEQAQCVRYLPDVVVEHRHPVAGKAAWDEGYRRVNDDVMYAKDSSAFAEYCHEGLPADVAKVRALRAGVAA